MTEGTLVGQGEVTLLTTVELIDPIYVNFSQSPLELQDLRQALVPGAHGADNTKVEVLLPDGTPHPYPGVLDFSDLAVDPGAGGPVVARHGAESGADPAPGSVRQPAAHHDPARRGRPAASGGAGSGPGRAYVLVVEAGGKVVQRRVQTHGMSRIDWILSGDLKGGDRVILSGLQKVKRGDQARVTGGVATQDAKSGPVRGT